MFFAEKPVNQMSKTVDFGFVKPVLLYFMAADGGCCTGDHAENCRALV